MAEPTASAPTLKRCTKCGELKPLDAFNHQAKSPDGHRPSCRACTTQASRQYRNANRDETLSRARQRRADNPEAALEYDRRRRERDREKIRERSRSWARANMGQQVEYQRQRTAQLRLAVFGHYGTTCACCGTPDRLTIDHVNGGGNEHREILFGNRKAAGRSMYLWLLRNNLPDGFQTLCLACNSSKKEGTHCRILHADTAGTPEVSGAGA